MNLTSVFWKAATATFLVVITTSIAEAITIPAAGRGWVKNNGGQRNGYSATNEYLVQQSSSSSTRYYNFFDFDLGTLAGTWVTSAVLKLEHGTSSNSPSNYPTYYYLRDLAVDPQTASAASLNSDIQSGTIYATAIAPLVSGPNEFFDITLNSSAQAAINAANLAGENFALGGYLSGPTDSATRFGGTGDGSYLTLLDLSLAGNISPAANFPNQSIQLGDGLLLDASTSIEIDSIYGDAIQEYAWDLNNDGLYDSTTSYPVLGINPTALPSLGINGPGHYPVKLRVTDAWGATGQWLGTVIVTDPVPEPSTMLLVCLSAMCFLARANRPQSPHVHPRNPPVTERSRDISAHSATFYTGADR